MANLPMVSIVIPFFNRKNTIRRALDSAIKQTYPKIEIVLIDDGSTDDYLSEIKEYIDRVTLIKQKNSGVAVARNHGIKIANGEFITFLDSDDEYELEYVEILMREILSSPMELVIGVCGVQWYDRNNLSSGIATQNCVAKINSTVDAVSSFLDSKITVGIHGKIFKKSFLEENKVFFPENTITGEDSVFVFRAIMRCKGAVIASPKVLYKVHDTEGSLCNSYTPKTMYVLHALDIIERELRNSELFEAVRDSYMAYYFKNLNWLFSYSNSFYDEHKGAMEAAIFRKMRYRPRDELVKIYRRRALRNRKTTFNKKVKIVLSIFCPAMYLKLIRARTGLMKLVHSEKKLVEKGTCYD